METSYETPTGIPSGLGEPTWEIAHLFPSQGDWGEAGFLALPAPHRFELSDSRLEVLPMPTWFHALIGTYLLKQLWSYLEANDVGLAVPAPLYVRLWPKEIRQPDVVFCFHEHILDRKKVQNDADLVFEIVSEGDENRKRDLEVKRELYAQAGFSEYWIIDPELRTITDQAASVVLSGFSVDVSAAFAAGEK